MPKHDVQKLALRFTRAVGSPTSIFIHSVIFIGSFFLSLFGWISLDRMLLVLTTIVSLEAIYLAIFIQMTINYTTETIREVEKDIDSIQENVGEIQEDVEEISEDVGEIQKDVDELQEDIEEISEDVEELNEEEGVENPQEVEQKRTLATIQTDLKKLMDDIARLQR